MQPECGELLLGPVYTTVHLDNLQLYRFRGRASSDGVRRSVLDLFGPDAVQRATATETSPLSDTDIETNKPSPLQSHGACVALSCAGCGQVLGEASLPGHSYCSDDACFDRVNKNKRRRIRPTNQLDNIFDAEITSIYNEEEEVELTSTADLANSLATFSYIRLLLHRVKVALFEFGMNTINLLNRPNKSIVPLADIQFRLSMNQFFKSVRNVIKTEGSSVDTVLNDTSCARMNLNSILHVYFLLSSAPSIHRYVLFPVGVVTCPSADNPYGAEIRQLLIGAMKPHFQGLVETSSFTHLPFLMYPELRASEGWHSSTLWPPSPLRDAYLLELGCAVAALNKAKVAHMDLRFVFRRSTSYVIQLFEFYCFLHFCFT